MYRLLQRDFDARELVRRYPPKLRHPHKQLVYELCGGADVAGMIAVTRWRAEPLPELAPVELAATEVVPMPGHYDYAGPQAGVWHVNFADPDLFYAYGSAL